MLKEHVCAWSDEDEEGEAHYIAKALTALCGQLAAIHQASSDAAFRSVFAAVSIQSRPTSIL